VKGKNKNSKAFLTGYPGAAFFVALPPNIKIGILYH